MSAHNNDARRQQNATTSVIDIWENEGGAHRHDYIGHHYGRRVEADRSWTVYHVFTGVPANIGGNAMIGLSRTAATDGMVSLNRRNEGPCRDRDRLKARIQLTPCTTEDRRL